MAQHRVSQFARRRLPLQAPAASLHRALSGSASLRSASTRTALRAPSRPLVQESDTGKRHARHPCRSCHLLIRVLIVGRHAPGRGLFRLISAPRILWGGRNGRSALSGSGFAAMVVSPLRPRWGYGGKRKEGYRQDSNRFRWSRRPLGALP
jgi:hypothetical protein